MYLTKNEILVITTLIGYLLLGGIISVIIFITGFIYLQFINNKMRYHIIRNDSEDAMMLEGGTSQRTNQMYKFGGVILLWIAVWYFKGFEFQDFEGWVLNLIQFWTFLVLVASFILSLDVGYRIFDTSVNSDAYTKREIMLAGSLLIEVITGFYYFYQWLSIGNHDMLFDPNMLTPIFHIIIFSAVAASALSLIVYGKQDEEAKDERDLAIEVKGYKYGFYTLTTLLALLIGQLISDSLAFGLWGERALNLNIVEIANLLLLGIILSWAVVSSAQLFFYRRGY